MEDWKYLKATEYCYNVTDGTHDSPKQSKDGKYLITSKYIKENRIDFDNAYRISLSDYTKIIERSRVDQWDIIISMIGAYCGYCYLEISTRTDYAIKNVGLFKVGNELKSRWLYYYLTSPQGKQQLAMLRTGSSQPYISLNSLRNIIIPTPRQNEMGRIVNILKSLDDKIELNRRINDNLEQQAQALFKAWFVDFEPFKDEKFVDSEFGRIPENWRIGTIEELCQHIASGSTPSSMNKEYYNGNIKWFTTKELNDTFLLDSEKHISEKGHQSSSTKMFPIGTVLMAIYAAPTVGRLGILTSNATFNQAAVGLTPKEEVGSNYIFLLLKNERYNFNNLAIGAAQQNLSVKFVKTYTTIIPSKKVISDFNVIINPIFNRIMLLCKENSSLTNLRDTLLPKLMSGKLKIE